MRKWFGSSGIRGPYDIISPEFAFKLGIAVGKTFSLQKPAYIASDIRATGHILRFYFMSGYSSVSGDIVDLGLCPTPISSYMSANEDTLGIMITASHNPPGYNGFKLFWQGGECSEAIEDKVEQELLSVEKSFSIASNSLHSWNSVGNCINISSEIIINDYIKYLKDNVTFTSTKSKIIVDCANNAPNIVSPLALQKFGFSQVLTINKRLDFTFPGRPSEPVKENLQGLIQSVIDNQADIGVAHDGDGDRFAIIDEKGNFLKATTLISFFIDHLDYSNPEKQIIYLTSDCTKEASEIAKKHGAKVQISRIGRNKEYVNEKGVLFLAEPNKLIFPAFGKWIDGLYPVVKLLEIIQDQKISKVMKDYDQRRVLRKAFGFTDENNIEILNQIENLPTLLSHRIKSIDKRDGIKIYFTDDSSVLIRFSGTEPKVKFYVESNSESHNLKLLSGLTEDLGLVGYGLDC